jgi:hypothetical protein
MRKVRKTTLAIVALFSIILSLNSCYFDVLDCINGDGISDEESRDLNDFSVIKHYGSFDVVIVQDSVYKVVVEAESNIIPYILTGVINGELIIKARDNRCLRPTTNIQITVYTPEVEKLYLAGSGSMVTDSIHSDQFKASITGSGFMRADVFATSVDLNISGSGDMDFLIISDYLEANISGSGMMKLQGAIHDSKMKITGSGDIKSVDMEQEVCEAKILGSGSAWVRVNNTLDATITGSGNVYYKGSPKIYSLITGSGSIIEL